MVDLSNMLIKINNYLAIQDYREFLSTRETAEYRPDVLLMVAKEQTVEPVDGITTLKYPIADGNIISFMAKIEDVMKQFDTASKSDKRLLICCDGTLSRSMTIIYYYMITVKNQVYPQVLSLRFLSMRENPEVSFDALWKIHPVFLGLLSSL